MNVDAVELYRKDATGTLRFWSIKVMDYDIVIEHGVHNGALQVKIEDVPYGKGGRDLEEQIQSRVDSRISKQKDRGYIEDMEAAKAATIASNALGTPRPMLAQPLKNVDMPTHYYLQYKFDGNRCLITKQNGDVFAYSRNGKLIESIDHILEAAKDIPEGCILDGELYHHGTSLQTIRSWISRNQADSQKLEYMLYDTMLPEPFEKRLGALRALNLSYPITLVNTLAISPVYPIGFDLIASLKEAIRLGYEGLIVRHGNSGYEAGKRSKSLVKVKAWLDDEFVVHDISASVDGWGILHMKAKNGKEFKASAPGSVDEKINVLLMRDTFIGESVTIQYANLTKEGKPFHPTAIAWRLPGE